MLLVQVLDCIFLYISIILPTLWYHLKKKFCSPDISNFFRKTMKIASPHRMPDRRGQHSWCWFTEQRWKLCQTEKRPGCPPNESRTKAKAASCRHIQDFSSSFLILTTFVALQFVELSSDLERLTANINFVNVPTAKLSPTDGSWGNNEPSTTFKLGIPRQLFNCYLTLEDFVIKFIWDTSLSPVSVLLHTLVYYSLVSPRTAGTPQHSCGSEGAARPGLCQGCG